MTPSHHTYILLGSPFLLSITIPNPSDMASGLAFRRNELQGYTMTLPEHVRSIDDWSDGHMRRRPGSSKQRVFQSQGRPSRGTLGRLPTEVLHAILRFLDVRTVLTVRRINNFYCYIVDGMSEYHLIQSHAPETFKVMNATKSSSFISLKDLFAEFTRSPPRCYTCSDFGPYLYLLGCHRCCFNCLLTRSEYHLGLPSNVEVAYAIPKELLDQLDQIYSLPTCRLWVCTTTSTGRYNLVSIPAAQKFAIEIYGSLDAAHLAADRLYDEAMVQWETQRAFNGKSYNKQREPTKPHVLRANPLAPRYLSTAAPLGAMIFPFWDIPRQSLEEGVYCSACVLAPDSFYFSDDEAFQNYHRAYLLREIPRHFQRCRAVKEGYGALIRQQQLKMPFWNSRSNYRQQPKIVGEEFFVNSDGQIDESLMEEYKYWQELERFNDLMRKLAPQEPKIKDGNNKAIYLTDEENGHLRQGRLSSLLR